MIPNAAYQSVGRHISVKKQEDLHSTSKAGGTVAICPRQKSAWCCCVLSNVDVLSVANY